MAAASVFSFDLDFSNTNRSSEMIISLDTFSYKSCKVTLDSVQKILEFSYYNVNIGTFSFPEDFDLLHILK